MPTYCGRDSRQFTAQGRDPRTYGTWMDSRPPKFEQDAVRLLVQLLDNDTTPAAPGFRLHIAHLADAGCLPILQARAAVRH